MSYVSKKLFLRKAAVLLTLLSAAAHAGEPARVIAADFVQTRQLADMDMTVKITGRMVCERGPIKVMPASSHASTNSGDSESRP